MTLKGNTTGGQYLLPVCDDHLKIRQGGSDGIRRLLEGVPIPKALSEIGEAFLSDVQGEVLLLYQFNGQTAVESVEQSHEDDKPQRIHHHLGQKDYLLQGDSGLKGFSQNQNQDTLYQFGYKSNGDKGEVPPGTTAESAVAQSTDDTKAKGTHPTGQRGEAARIKKIAVQAAESARAQSGKGAAHKTSSHSAHHPRVDYRPL